MDYKKCGSCWFPLVLSALGVLIAGWLWAGDQSVSDENHLMENSQVFFLMLAVGLHLKHRLTLQLPLARICHMTLALLCLSVMIREIDIDKLGTHTGWDTLEKIIRGVLVLFWVVHVVSVWRCLGALWALREKILFSQTSFLTAIAIGFYCVSYLFDKRLIPVEADLSQFIEESIQLTGTIFFFAASLLPLSQVRSD